MNAKEELVREWFHKAEHDIGMAKLALERNPEYTDSICFHSQQASEKYLKAYLVYLDISFRKTHSLTYLLDLIKEKDDVPDEIYDMAEELEGYAVEVRYPDDWYEPTIEETKDVCRKAAKIEKFVKNKILFKRS